MWTFLNLPLIFWAAWRNLCKRFFCWWEMSFYQGALAAPTTGLCRSVAQTQLSAGGCSDTSHRVSTQRESQTQTREGKADFQPLLPLSLFFFPPQFYITSWNIKKRIAWCSEKVQPPTVLINIFLNPFRLSREEHESQALSNFHKRDLTSSARITTEPMKSNSPFHFWHCPMTYTGT